VSDDSVWARPSESTPEAQQTQPSVQRPDAGDQVVLRASGITRTFKRGSEDVNALNGAELELSRGELVALVGRSGSGKTTLLNVLCGWEQPDAGTVSWSGSSVPGAGSVAVSDVRWEGIALVPQSPGLLEDLSVFENVGLPCRLRGDSTASTHEAVADLLAALGLGHLSERFPDELSLGEQQRVSVARGLVVRPDLLLADEPTAHQDAASMQRVLDTIRSVVDSGRACLVASHSSEVLNAADRVLEIRDGRISQLSKSAH
jgi:ABC-type lipoprotein export system ATPase subunit